MIRRRLLRLAAALVVLVLAFAGAGAGYLLSLPGVGDARARTAALVAVHQGRESGLPPPARLGEAVVAVEDRHFNDNFVFNLLTGAARAALATLHTSGDPGGSTIDQQLAKALYGERGGLSGTLREIGLAVKLSLHYSRAQILSMYLNAVYYGHGYFGDEQAARGYFGVSPRALSWSEVSLLAGLPQAPSAYDPLAHLTLARERQRHVLDRLVATGVLNAAAANAAFAAPLPLRR